jgi:hypothetical protein
MVAEISERVALEEYRPRVEMDAQKTAEPEIKAAQSADDSGNPVVVSKDFILNLLSLAIGKPFFLEGNLGNKIDVKV